MAGMRLTIVGCSGSYPGPGGAASCYLVEADDAEGRTWRLVLDMGNGALGALHHVVDPLAVDAVLLSHLHVDHCIDLASYYVLRKYHPSGQQPPIPVWGPKGTARRMARAYGLPKKPGMKEEFDFRRFDEPFGFGPFLVTPVPVDHPVDAFGLRIEAGGRTLAYTGDTGPTEALTTLARDADLFLAEASFRAGDDNPPHLHLTGADAGAAATAAGARLLVVTHVPPWHDADGILAEARATYAGPAELAKPGAIYEL